MFEGRRHAHGPSRTTAADVKYRRDPVPLPIHIAILSLTSDVTGMQRTDIAAHAALMGFSVQLFETLAWAEEFLDAATEADVRRLPRLYTGAGYACFAGRAEAARTNAHRATELEQDERYDACPPGYAAFIEALGSVYCGDLDRYVELTEEVARLYGRERRAFGRTAHGCEVRSSPVRGVRSTRRTRTAPRETARHPRPT